MQNSELRFHVSSPASVHQYISDSGQKLWAVEYLSGRNIKIIQSKIHVRNGGVRSWAISFRRKQV